MLLAPLLAQRSIPHSKHHSVILRHNDTFQDLELKILVGLPAHTLAQKVPPQSNKYCLTSILRRINTSHFEFLIVSYTRGQKDNKELFCDRTPHSSVIS